MPDNLIKKITESVEDFRLPKYAEIPNVGLYLNQTEKYIGDLISKFGNISLTSSMISNYVKQKLITSPVKKQYFRDQIVDLIFIALSKSVMSIDKVKMVLDYMINTHNRENVYMLFSDELVRAIRFSCGKDPEYITVLKNGTKESREKQLLHSIVIAIADSIFLDKYFALINN